MITSLLLAHKGEVIFKEAFGNLIDHKAHMASTKKRTGLELQPSRPRFS